MQNIQEYFSFYATVTGFKFLNDPEEIKKNGNSKYLGINRVIPAEPCSKDRFLN